MRHRRSLHHGGDRGGRHPRQPDPEGYLLACRRLGVAPGDAVFEDSAAGLQAGRRAGARCFAVGGAARTPALCRLADHAVEDLARAPVTGTADTAATRHRAGTGAAGQPTAPGTSTGRNSAACRRGRVNSSAGALRLPLPFCSSIRPVRLPGSTVPAGPVRPESVRVSARLGAVCRCPGRQRQPSSGATWVRMPSRMCAL
ncbi:HAD family hydrolase [Streptomyces sp. NPDC127079]|uniref:HAD family hydrolase n=1 Tax=Streptomyces sp. NPDC127079 TaxID=3347132 RepID=UPI00366A1B28